MADVNIKIQLQAQQAVQQLNKLNASLDKTVANQEKLSRASRNTAKSIRGLENAGKTASRGLSIANIALSSFIGNITSRAVSAGVTSIINGLRGIVQAGRDFEDGLISVGKTTGISGQSLQQLGDDISAISREIPVSTKELLDLATVAGQLGLKSSEDITQFTETLGKLTLATDIAGEEGAQSVAKILTITGELEDDGSQNIDKFGNVITRLGNNFAATEGQILKVATRVAQGTAAFNVASEDVLGIATALKATGSEAEASGTAIQKTFRLIGEATQEGGESLQRFADAAGLTTEEFTNLFEQDPAKLFSTLTRSLGESGKTGAELNKVLADLGLSDERLVRTLNPLIARYETLDRAIADARAETKSKTALDEESAKAADTLSGDIQQLSNSFDQLAKELFEQVGPALRSIVQATTRFVDFVKNNRQTIVGAFTAIGAAAGIMWAGITGPIGLVIAGLGSLSFALGKLADDTRAAERATEEFNQQVDGLSESYKDLDKNTQNYLDSLNEYTRGTTGANSVEQLFEESIGGVNENLVERIGINEEVIESENQRVEASKRVLFFEQDKLEGLKKFFSEEEAAKLESNFAILQSEKEKEAFTSLFASEGTKRQREAFLAKLGLDRATIEAEKAKQQELQDLRKAQDQFEQEQEQKRLQRQEQLRLAQEEAKLAEQQAELLRQEGEIAFEDEEFARLTAHLDRKTQAEIAAREANLQDEIQKQQLLAEVRQKAAQNEITQRERAKNQAAALERQKQNLTVGLAKAGANAIFQLAGANNKALFALNKAFAAVDIILKGLQGEALAVAQLGAFAAPAVAGIRANTTLQLATLAATTLGEVASGRFEQGGIVGGTSFTGDKVNARVNSGEMILNRQQQSQLFAMANGRGGSDRGQEIVVNTKVQLNEETIAEAVSRQVANGLQLGEVQ